MSEISKHEITFSRGGLWEEREFVIALNHVISGYSMSKGDECPHCVEQPPVVHKQGDGSTYEEAQWICPRVVIATNEGGYNSTGVCLDCILEAAKTL